MCCAGGRELSSVGGSFGARCAVIGAIRANLALHARRGRDAAVAVEIRQWQREISNGGGAEVAAEVRQWPRTCCCGREDAAVAAEAELGQLGLGVDAVLAYCLHGRAVLARRGGPR